MFLQLFVREIRILRRKKRKKVLVVVEEGLSQLQVIYLFVYCKFLMKKEISEFLLRVNVSVKTTTRRY